MSVDAHTEHCCYWHGCKYFDRYCSVVNDKNRQIYPCDICRFQYEEYVNALRSDRAWVRFMEKNA